jgi:hypothetical protein
MDRYQYLPDPTVKRLTWVVHEGRYWFVKADRLHVCLQDAAQGILPAADGWVRRHGASLCYVVSYYSR